MRPNTDEINSIMLKRTAILRSLEDRCFACLETGGLWRWWKLQPSPAQLVAGTNTARGPGDEGSFQASSTLERGDAAAFTVSLTAAIAPIRAGNSAKSGVKSLSLNIHPSKNKNDLSAVDALVQFSYFIQSILGRVASAHELSVI